MISFIVVAAVIVAGILLFTKTGKRIRIRASGTADEIITNDAKTPEGAKAYYNSAISKREEDYRNAYALHAQMVGKIKSFEDQVHALQKDNMKIAQDIESCLDRNDDAGAKVYLKKKQDNADKMSTIKDALKELRENEKLQKENVDALATKLSDLKAEKDKAILTLEASQVTNSLKATGASSSEEDRMLEKVREGVRKSKEESDGNRIAYESSASVQQQRLDKQMREDDLDRQLQELKAERNKKE